MVYIVFYYINIQNANYSERLYSKLGLKTFINNIRYLSRYNLKKIDKDINYLVGGLDFLKYEMKDDLKNIYIPEILSVEDTVQYIIDNKSSISRFGDGEFLLINNKSIGFQKADCLLAQKLQEVLSSKVPNLEIGMPGGMCRSTWGNSDFAKRFTRSFWGNNIDWIIKLLDKKRVYLDTNFTILPDSIERYRKIQSIWENRKITVICGDRVVKNIKYNVFDNAKDIEYMFAPTVNAFDKYEEILKRAKQTDKNRLVIIILGPTATVLAYDMAKLGYQALDMGHIVKSYDFFMQKQVSTPEALNKFFGKD